LHVSTLLEILGAEPAGLGRRVEVVSTLLEILE